MKNETAYGTWWHPNHSDHEVTGTLTWHPLRVPELSVMDPPLHLWAGDDGSRFEGVPLGGSASIAILHGLLADEGEITLLGCTYGGMALGKTHTYRFRAWQALKGIWLDHPEEPFARRIEAELPALALLLGQYPVRPAALPKGRSRKVTLDLEQRQLSWRADGCEVSWQYNPRTSVRDTSTRVSMTPTVTLTSPRPRSIGYWAGDWLYPINRLVEVATGRKSNPRMISAWPKKHLSPAEKHTTRVAIWSKGVGAHDFQHDENDVLISAADIARDPARLPDVVRHVRRLASEQEVFLDLLSDTITHQDRPIRNRYLDLVSGLEAFHTQIHGLGSISPDDFKRQRATAIAEIASIDPAARRFIKRWLPGKPHRSLEYRLRALRETVGTLDGWNVSAEQMARIRNNVAHGNSETDEGLLKTAYDQAFDLARRLVLHELGLLLEPESQ